MPSSGTGEPPREARVSGESALASASTDASSDNAKHALDDVQVASTISSPPPPPDRVCSPPATVELADVALDDTLLHTKPSLRSSSLRATASARGPGGNDPHSDSKDYWRQLRSRKVMRQLQTMAKISAWGLKLGDLEDKRNARNAFEERRVGSGEWDELPRGDAKGTELNMEKQRTKQKSEAGTSDAELGRHSNSDDDDEKEIQQEDLDELEDKLSAWLQCSGLHTIDKWVLNYRKHPSCWAALLMMHGVPEVSGRLRAKVENYAIYSALFLSCTIQAVMSPPVVMQCDEREFASESAERQCQVTRRIAVYALLGAVAMHFYSIILAMAFVNALNETAREADVYRMFARGQGYLATYKCQQAFRHGAGFCMVAIAAVSLEYIGWDAVVWIAILLGYILHNFKRTSNLLFSTGSLVHYWRTELGGKPDADDPYEIAPAVRVFKERVKFSRGVLGDEDAVDNDALGGVADGKLWRGAGEDRAGPGGGGARVWKTGTFVGTSGWSWSSNASNASNNSSKGERKENALTSSKEANRTETSLNLGTVSENPGTLLKIQREKRIANAKERKTYNDQHHGTHVGSKAAAIL